MLVPFPKNWIELQSQAADIEIGAETIKPLKIIKEHSLIVTRVMAGYNKSLRRACPSRPVRAQRAQRSPPVAQQQTIV